MVGNPAIAAKGDLTVGGPRIEIAHVTKQYGDSKALDDLTLEVGPGELFCFLGPNGAGKTTTIHTVMGQKMVTSGDIHVNGVSVTSAEIHLVRRKIGYLAEQPELYGHLTGREFLLFMAELYGLDVSRLRWIDVQLDRFELGDDADVLLKCYSMGMRKKIALLAALLHEPDILLLDEPTGALDAASARLAKDFMIEARNSDKLVFFTTHVMEIAELLADRIGIIHRGRLVAEGTLVDLCRRNGRGPGERLEDVFLRITGSGAARSEHRPPRASDSQRPRR
jgi:ABC-2 type transport system ATP-binding protein